MILSNCEKERSIIAKNYSSPKMDIQKISFEKNIRYLKRVVIKKKIKKKVIIFQV